MVEFKRKKGEKFESFLRRFNAGLKRSKKLFKAREKQHLSPTRTKRQQKDYALASLKLRIEKEYLRKIGKLNDDNNRKR